MKFRLGVPAVSRIGSYWLLWVPLFVGSINVQSVNEPLLFSERWGNRRRPSLTIGSLRFSWVQFR